MKTLIVYASKYGAIKECVSYIKKRMGGETTVINLTKQVPDHVLDYDTVLIGSSVYAGRLRPEIKKFYEQNKGELEERRVAVFLSCLDGSKEEEYLKSTFPEEFVHNLYACAECGGILDLNQMNFLERMVIKLIMKNHKEEGREPVKLKNNSIFRTINRKAMDEFVVEMKR